MTRHLFRTAILGALGAMVATGPAMAHPHVWVVSKSRVLVDSDAVAAIEQVWTFDEFYSTMAVQGLDTNNDGQYSKAELAELAKINMEGLKEFGYFTEGRAGEAKLAFATPTNAFLDYTGGILTLHFKLPLAAPAKVTDFTFATYDPSFFIAFEAAKEDAVTLAGAPASCGIELRDTETAAPRTPEGDNQTLAGAFAQQFGGASVLSTKWASVQCRKA